MTELLVRAIDVLALGVLGALVAGLVWLVLDFVRDLRYLDDPPANRWPETPGQRNDRQRLMGEQ